MKCALHLFHTVGEFPTEVLVLSHCDKNQRCLINGHLTIVNHHLTIVNHHLTIVNPVIYIYILSINHSVYSMAISGT